MYNIKFNNKLIIILIIKIENLLLLIILIVMKFNNVAPLWTSHNIVTS